jgi:hypothetical protein
VRATLVTTNGTGKLVEPTTMAVIRLVVGGWLQHYIYNENLLQNRLMAGSKLPRAMQLIAGRKALFAGRNDKSAGGK